MTKPSRKAWWYGELQHRVNTLATWRNVDEVEASGFTGEVGIRCLIPQYEVSHYRITAAELRKTVAMLSGLDIPADKLVFYERPPDDRLILQGELQRTVAGLYLRWTTCNRPLSHALKDPGVDVKHEHGLAPLLRLNESLTPNAYDMLMAILDDYKAGEGVIEFSAYACHVGTMSHNNVIVWEVRDY